MARTTRYCATCLTTFFEDPARCTNLSCGVVRPEPGWGVLLGPGDLLDRHYLVERVLAVGGAGLTYLAREVDGEGTAVGPKVAIKVLYTARDTGSFLRRLSNEAQILQELSHAHIVHCLGFVQRSGQEPYLVTRFEEGGSLQQHLERVGPLPPRVAVAIMRQILLALDVAHQRGVVHRDLKPDNVLLDRPCRADETPHVRVADFGIAKVHGGLTDRLTKLGSFVGTPEYAAPEQFEGLPPTPATDLFAAGGVLWFLLTGQVPVRFSQRHDLGTSYDELMEQVPPKLHTSPAAASLDAEERELLQDVLDHLMAHQGESRWTVHQVLHRLLPLSDASLQRGVSTLEFTAGGSPMRVASPSATLDTTGGLPAPFVGEADTAVPTLGSATLDEPPPETMPSVARLDTVPPPPPERPPPPPLEAPTPPEPPETPDTGGPRGEPRPSLPETAPEPVADAPKGAGTAWVPRAELAGGGLTPGPAPRALPNPALARTEPTPAPAPPRPEVPVQPMAPPPAAPPVEGGSMAGGAVQAAGCLGLSFMGVAATGGVGVLATGVLLLGAAWGLGWFAGPVTTAPLEVHAEPPFRWDRVPHLLGSGPKAVTRRRAVQDAVNKKSVAIGRTCRARGRVVADLLYEPEGQIVFVLVDDGWLPEAERRCVEKELTGLDLGVRIAREMRVRVALSLD